MPGLFQIDHQQFSGFCKQQGLLLEDAQLTAMRTYLELLIGWNKKINLTALSDWRTAMLELVADSFQLHSFLDRLPLNGDVLQGEKAKAYPHTSTYTTAGTIDKAAGIRQSNRPHCWDLGAGAGLPGIPLRIVWPSGSYHLIELREKRALFLQTVLARLKLAGSFVHRKDAGLFMSEECGQGRPADLILSRAFMPWQKLPDYVRPYLATGGILLLMLNGSHFEAEIPGWELVAHCSYKSPPGPRQLAALTPKQRS